MPNLSDRVLTEELEVEAYAEIIVFSDYENEERRCAERVFKQKTCPRVSRIMGAGNLRDLSDGSDLEKHIHLDKHDGIDVPRNLRETWLSDPDLFKNSGRLGRDCPSIRHFDKRRRTIQHFVAVTWNSLYKSAGSSGEE